MFRLFIGSSSGLLWNKVSECCVCVGIPKEHLTFTLYVCVCLCVCVCVCVCILAQGRFALCKVELRITKAYKKRRLEKDKDWEKVNEEGKMDENKAEGN